MTPAPAGEEPEQGRSQPFVPLFSGRGVLVVVFNEPRSMELDPAAAREAPAGFWTTMTCAGCQCEDVECCSLSFEGSFQGFGASRLSHGDSFGRFDGPLFGSLHQERPFRSTKDHYIQSPWFL